MLTNNYQSLDDLRFLAGKCPRCSLCKFPPLTVVEQKAFSAICPSYEEFKYHASSGGGRLVMAMSLLEGRSQWNENVRSFVYGCTTCGGCDIACKFSSDIEVLEIIYQLRAKCFREMGPLPEHERVLRSIGERGHPLPDEDGDLGDWMAEAGIKRNGSTAQTLVWVGPHYALQKSRRPTLLNALGLLRTGGISFDVLGAAEPYAGRAALEIGDRELFARCARKAAEAIERSGAREVICLSAEDYATLRAQAPRFAKITKPVRHVTEVYADLIAKRRLHPVRAANGVVAWHDPAYLGRLSEPFVPWQGERKKVFGQLIVYDPARPVNRGTHGCYEPPRRVLAAIPGLEIREFYRRREYAFSSGEGGQAGAVAPDFVIATARRRVEEALAVGVDRIVTECPQSLVALARACAAVNGGTIQVASLTDLLARSV